jgi:diguanylate cyclase (GGDEF)-like protein
MGRGKVELYCPNSLFWPNNCLYKQIVDCHKDRVDCPMFRDLRWLFILPFSPIITGVIASGGLPSSIREWVTAAISGFVILLLVVGINKEHKDVRALATNDMLTGLENRRAFEEAVAKECLRAKRTQTPLSLLYLDLDQFKSINDRFGHAFGDQVLKQFAQVLEQVGRVGIDRSFRLGGDEFVMLLPGCSKAQVEGLIRRICLGCTMQGAAWTEGSLGVSAGAAELLANETPQEFVARADKAMYLEKNSLVFVKATS